MRADRETISHSYLSHSYLPRKVSPWNPLARSLKALRFNPETIAGTTIGKNCSTARGIFLSRESISIFLDALVLRSPSVKMLGQKQRNEASVWNMPRRLKGRRSLSRFALSLFPRMILFLLPLEKSLLLLPARNLPALALSRKAASSVMPKDQPQYIETEWEWSTYDLWGNARDGWNVNDVYPQGKVTIPALIRVNNLNHPSRMFISAEITDSALRKALQIRCRFEDSGGGDDTHIYLETSSGKPLCELYCVSHSSLSPPIPNVP